MPSALDTPPRVATSRQKMVSEPLVGNMRIVYDWRQQASSKRHLK
jgi:hypothetical protein